MPRAAALSICARVAGTEPTTWQDPALVQLWGPRCSAYVVAAADRALFSLRRLPDDAAARLRADDLASRLEDLLGGERMAYGEAERALGIPPDRLKYAAPTGRVLMVWDGARQPVVWTVPPPEVDRSDARLELARSYLRVFGPGTPEGFATWAGIPRRADLVAFGALGDSLIPAATPIGNAWILAVDESALRAAQGPAAAARLIPSGDAHFLLQGDDRAILVPDAGRRGRLWKPRGWPGAVLVAGEIVGTWRRADDRVTIHRWRRLSPRERQAVVAEAASLPLPGTHEQAVVRWDE